MKSISAAEANRHFSSLLREVSRGARVTITSRGKPVVTIMACEQEDGHERTSAKRTLLSRLRAIPAAGKRRWSRDELYE